MIHSSSVLALGQSLFPLFALALGLSEDFFDDKVILTSTSRTGIAYRNRKTKYPAAIMRMLHYPPVAEEEVKEDNPGIGVSKLFTHNRRLTSRPRHIQVRLSLHTGSTHETLTLSLDWECFTILAQSGVSGLQVQNRKGQGKSPDVRSITNFADCTCRDRCPIHSQHICHQHRRPVCSLDK